jgi:hypothetical protein
LLALVLRRLLQMPPLWLLPPPVQVLLALPRCQRLRHLSALRHPPDLVLP